MCSACVALETSIMKLCSLQSLDIASQQRPHAFPSPHILISVSMDHGPEAKCLGRGVSNKICLNVKKTLAPTQASDCRAAQQKQSPYKKPSE